MTSGMFLNIAIIWLKVSFVPITVFFIHNIGVEYSPDASLHSKLILEVNTFLLLATI